MRKEIVIGLLGVVSLLGAGKLEVEKQDYQTCKRVYNLSHEIYDKQQDGDRIAWCSNTNDDTIMFLASAEASSEVLTQRYGKNNWKGWLINYNRFLCFAKERFPDTKQLNGLLARLEAFFTYRITKEGAKKLKGLTTTQQKLSGFFAMNDPRVEDNMIRGFNVLHRIYMGYDYAYQDPEINKFVELIGNGDIQNAWQFVLNSKRTHGSALAYCHELENKYGKF